MFGTEPLNTPRTGGNAQRLPEICYDPENVLLEGWYPDELSAYRARTVWKQTLSHHFLLEYEEDFQLSIERNKTGDVFQLSCTFYTACARYAFWRITNEQAPEVQYLLETAHIPKSSSNTDLLLSAPDMRCVTEGHLLISKYGEPPELNTSWLNGLKRIFQKLSE